MVTLLAAVVDVIGTLLCAATAVASASASSARALSTRDLVVARIELDEHRAGFDQLVVVDGDLRDGAADARRDLRHMRIDLRIVGRLAAGGQPEPDADADDRERRRRRRAMRNAACW